MIRTRTLGSSVVCIREEVSKLADVVPTVVVVELNRIDHG